MGCLTLSVTRIGGGMSADMERRGGSSAAVVRQEGMAVRIGLVCPIGVGRYEVLSAQDGDLLTVDGGYLFVRR